MAEMSQGQLKILIIFGFCLLLLLIFAWKSWYLKKRRLELLTLATQLGLEYQGVQDLRGYLYFTASPVLPLTPWLALPLFKLGTNRRVIHVVFGTYRGFETHIMDYQYQVGRGKNSRHYLQTVFSFKLPRADVPPFSLRHESFLDSLGDWVGFKDIDFGDDPMFSKSFHLVGSDETTVRSFFKSDILALFNPNLVACCQGEGSRVISIKKIAF